MHIAWGPFLVALFVIVVVPGPDFVMVTSNAATKTKYGWLAAAGVTCGLLVHATAATAGLSALLVTVPGALLVVKAVGAAYLIWMGVQLLRQAGKSGGQFTAAAPPRSGLSVFLRGLLTDVLNPKIMLMFLTLLPQAMDAGGDPVAQASLLSGVTGAAFAAWWLLVIPPVRWFARFSADARRRKVFERCCGSALLVMATSVALS